MFLRLVKWTLGAFVLGIVALALFIDFSARNAFDTQRQYAAASEALPLFGAATTDGLVRLPLQQMQFRARIGGFTPAADGSDRPTVILLHGWPVTSAMWTPLIQPLVDAGYRVLAPDQRGYSPGARPEGRASYTVDKLSTDVIAFADAIGAQQFHLVGHDWGAVVGWDTVLTHPERVLSWSGLSIAHPASFVAAMEVDPDQAARSRYFMLFATPWLAESIFAMRDFSLLKAVYGPMPEEAKQEYLAMFSEPGALSGGFNWYRAMMLSGPDAAQRQPEVSTPTLFIWGNRDGAVGRWAIDDQARFMRGPYEVIELEAGHWLLETVADEVVPAVLRHIQSYP